MPRGLQGLPAPGASMDPVDIEAASPTEANSGKDMGSTRPEASWLVRQASHASEIAARQIKLFYGIRQGDVFMALISIWMIIIICLLGSRHSDTDLVSSQADLLRRDVPLTQLNNFWEICRAGSFPLIFTTLLWWVPIVEEITRIVESVDLDNHDAHRDMVKAAKKWSKHDIVAAILLHVTADIIWLGAVTQGYTYTDGTLKFGIFGALFFPVSQIIPSRALRISLVRREGVEIMAYVNSKLRFRVLLLYCIAVISLGYVWVTVINSPPFASSITEGDSPSDAPCGIARNATYVKELCVIDGGAQVPPFLICDDGGFHEYISAEAACVAAEQYFSTSSMSFAFLITWVCFHCFLFWRSFTDADEGVSLKLPRTRVMADAAFIITGGIGLPLALGTAFGPATLLRNNYIASGFFGNALGAFVIGGFVVAGILRTAEVIARAVGGLTAGTELTTRNNRGKTTTIKKELELFMGPNTVAASGTQKAGFLSMCDTLKFFCNSWCPRTLVDRVSTNKPLSDMDDIRENLRRDLSNTTRAEKFAHASPKDLVLGKPKDAALGIDYYMRVGTSFASAALGYSGQFGSVMNRLLPTCPLTHCTVPSLEDGVRAISREIAKYGTDDDRENLHYILHEEAGTNPKVFDNGGLKRDCDKQGNVMFEREGKFFADFVKEAQTRTMGEDGRPSPVFEAHVLGMRLYTTSVRGPESNRDFRWRAFDPWLQTLGRPSRASTFRCVTGPRLPLPTRCRSQFTTSSMAPVSCAPPPNRTTWARSTSTAA